MVFQSDKQRKAVMAKLNNQPRASVSPQVVKDQDGLGRAIRERIARFRQRQEARSVERRKERISRELTSQAAEGKRARQLESELKLEQSRERIRLQTEKTQQEFRRIERTRREARLAPLKEIGRRIKGGVIQIERRAKQAQRIRRRIEARPRLAPRRRLAPRAAPRRRRVRRRRTEEVFGFGV